MGFLGVRAREGWDEEEVRAGSVDAERLRVSERFCGERERGDVRELLQCLVFVRCERGFQLVLRVLEGTTGGVRAAVCRLEDVERNRFPVRRVAGEGEVVEGDDVVERAVVGVATVAGGIIRDVAVSADGVVVAGIVLERVARGDENEKEQRNDGRKGESAHGWSPCSWFRPTRAKVIQPFAGESILNIANFAYED